MVGVLSYSYSLILREDPFKKMPALFGHCPNSDCPNRAGIFLNGSSLIHLCVEQSVHSWLERWSQSFLFQSPPVDCLPIQLIMTKAVYFTTEMDQYWHYIKLQSVAPPGRTDVPLFLGHRLSLHRVFLPDPMLEN